MNIVPKLVALLLAGSLAAPVSAQPVADANGFARLGLARVRLADEGPIFIMGTYDPQADYVTPEKWVANVDLGYFVAPQIAVQVSATSPMTTPNLPTGSLEGTPNLGDDTFTIFTASATWHPLRGRAAVSPYVGGGLAWQHLWDIKDGFAQNLDIDDTIGPMIQAGIEIPVRGNFGFFFDAKKAFYKTDASADLVTPMGTIQITAKPELDPLILSAGVLVRF